MSAILFYQMGDLNLEEKRVLIREDFNVPMENGKITDDARIRRALPTIKMAMESGASIMLMSHLGRPVEGEFDEKFSLAPVANRLSELLRCPVPLVNDWVDGFPLNPGGVVLLENVRFNVGENANDEELAKKMAKLCDLFVMDAFATAHRAQASTVGVAKYAKKVCGGPLLVEEIQALSQAFDAPEQPFAAIVGGSKVSSKINLLSSLVNKVNQLIVGGGIANTFLKARGYNIGKSLYEPDWVENARALMQEAEKKGVEIPLPTDVVTAKTLSPTANAVIKSVNDIASDDCIFDVGPETSARYKDLFAPMKTIVWNGPVGVFEIDAFSKGTQALAQAVASSHAFSLAGGGDTLAALAKYQVSNKISYISTGGGAFLEYLEGQTLPAIAVLQERSRD